jgi:hypothetical protein
MHHPTLSVFFSVDSRTLQACEIKSSQWGLGMYITEPAEQDDLISGMSLFLDFSLIAVSLRWIEYIGELILEETVESREYVAGLI